MIRYELILVCDSCPAEYVLAGRPHLDDARLAASEEGWSSEGKFDFCPRHTKLRADAAGVIRRSRGHVQEDLWGHISEENGMSEELSPGVKAKVGKLFGSRKAAES